MGGLSGVDIIMGFYRDDGFLPCAWLNWGLGNEGIEDVGEINLRCFKAFKETSDSKLVADSGEYLFRCIEKRFSQMFFNYFSAYYDSITKYSISKGVHKDMKIREIMSLLRKIFEEKANELTNSEFTYIKLSQLLQMRIHVRSLNNCKKLKVYDIVSTPYNLYILEAFDKKYFLEPFDENYDWRTKELNHKSITSNYIKWLDDTATKEFCGRCGNTEKIVCCVNFHKHCFECLDSCECRDCAGNCMQSDLTQADPLLVYFYCLKGQEESVGKLRKNRKNCELCGSFIKLGPLCSYCSRLKKELSLG